MSGIEISKKKVIINSISSACSLILNLSVFVWLQQFLLKHISPEEYSLIPLLTALIAFTPLLTMILTSGLGRYITIAYAKNDNYGVTQICSTMFPLLFIAGIILLLAGLFAAWNIDKLLEIPTSLVNDARIMMSLLVFLSAIQLPLSIFGSGFLVSQKLLVQDMIDIGCQLFRICTLFILLFGFGAQALWVTVAMVSSELLKLLIATPLSLHYLPSQKINLKLFKWSTAKDITGYGGWGFLNQIGETLKQAMDPILLNRFSTAIEVTMYNVAGIVPRQLGQLLIPITRPFFPVLAAMCATEDYEKLRNTYLRTARYHAWVLIFFSTPLIVFNRELMHLYLNGKYDNTGSIMALLLGVTIFNSFNALGTSIAAASGHIKGISLRQVAMQLTNLILTICFVVFLGKGAWGSAISSLLASLLIEVFLIWPFCRKLAHTTTTIWLNEVLLPTIIPAIPSFIFCLLVKFQADISSWFTLFGISAISGSLYLLLLLRFALRQQDKIDLAELSKKIPPPAKAIIHILTGV